ncbi:MULTISPECIES: hypothetical protein [unclassified Streptomyces]|uniref:hypothetical protein n=1 Tax=Streptomyces TaxID=1883 RepID=UPI00081B5CE3|nr:hypothetical protein [Streptomyces sp. BvitLS-983]MYX88383.1 hypothetical protein [Streptomyces sp. SID4915]WTC46185.1 hypothetical protein OH810_31590 [Streptomyces albidoflavus]SCE16242.1 hypothetical protein GA0115250_144710 [Streptomyces sp. BvitLS-983]
MIGIDPAETADALDDHGEFAGAELMRELDAENSALRVRLNAVLALCEEAGTKGITSGGLFTVDAVREAAAERTTEK